MPHCGLAVRKNERDVTDRQNRNRAKKCIDKRVMKRCAFCGSPDRMRIHHLNGIESDNRTDNLIGACHADNAKVAFVLRRYGIGRRVDMEYNPAEPAKSLAQWMMAVKSLRGDSSDMSPRDAIAMIRATSPARRSSFADEIWRIRRARGTDTYAAPF